MLKRLSVFIISIFAANSVFADSLMILPNANASIIYGVAGMNTGGTFDPSNLVFSAQEVAYPNVSIATASIVGQPTASASATGLGEADLTTTYYARVVGPDGSAVPPNTTVPLSISGTATASLGPVFNISAVAYSEVKIVDLSLDLVVLDITACVGTPCNDFRTQIFPGGYDLPFTVNSSDEFSISVSAVATPNDSGGVLGTSANAVADPFIQIDPTFLENNPGDSLAFSPDITNAATSAPEPSSLVLLSGALVLWICFRRLHRTTIWRTVPFGFPAKFS
jgi:hypothetical protein